MKAQGKTPGIGRLALAFLIAGLAQGLVAEGSTQVDLEAGAAFVDGAPAAAGSFSLSAERRADITAGRASFTLQGRAGTALSGSAEGKAQLSWMPGAFVSVLSLEGGISDASDIAGSWRGGGELLLALDGLDASASLLGGIERRNDEGSLSTLATAGIHGSLTAGETLLKPRMDASLSMPDTGTETLTILPGLGLSWYPGFPLSFSASAGWSRAFAAASAEDSLISELSLYASLGRLFASLEGSGTLGQGGFSAASAALELSWEAGRIGKARLAIPLRASWVLDGDPGFTVFAGASFGLD